MLICAKRRNGVLVRTVLMRVKTPQEISLKSNAIVATFTVSAVTDNHISQLAAYCCRTGLRRQTKLMRKTQLRRFGSKPRLKNVRNAMHLSRKMVDAIGLHASHAGRNSVGCAWAEQNATKHLLDGHMPSSATI